MYHLRRISKIRQYITQSACEKLVHAFITSRLDYGNAILYGLPQYKLEKLQRIVNAAARIVSKTKRFDHVTPVLHQLHWLPIEERTDFKVLLLTFRAYHQTAPEYINELVTKYVPSRHLRSPTGTLLTVQKSRTKRYGERSFSFAGPHLWNSLPDSLRNIKCFETFKRHLKKHLFQKAYNSPKRNRFLSVLA